MKRIFGDQAPGGQHVIVTIPPEQRQQVHGAQCTVRSAQSNMWLSQFPQSNMCTVHNAECTEQHVHHAQCTVHSAQYTVHSAKCDCHTSPRATCDCQFWRQAHRWYYTIGNNSNIERPQWQRWQWWHGTMAMSALTATMLMASESWCPTNGTIFHSINFNGIRKLVSREVQQMIQFSVQSITSGPSVRITSFDQ